MTKVLLLIAIISSFLFAETHNHQAFEVKKSYKINFDKNTTCLVRNFALYKEPKWVAQIETRSGKTAYFSSPKSLFEFYHRPGKWFDMGVKSERDFSAIVVTDYNTHKAIDGENAFFVYGSRATSPAGDDLVPFATKEAAEKFAAAVHDTL